MAFRIKIRGINHYFKILISALICLNMYNSHSQDLKAHKWKNRVLLVLSQDVNNGVYLSQIQELKSNEKGLNERKLLVYHLMPSQFKKDLKNGTWKSSESFYKTYKKTKAEFEIILIGLDGGIKLQQTQLLSCPNLFSIIDGMPMRRKEINKLKRN